MRRTAAWKPIAGVAAATIAIAGFGVAPATAAPDDPEQALARVLGSSLVAEGLLDAATAYTGTTEPENPVANPLTLDSDLLGASVGVTPGLQLPLIDDGSNSGLLALGEAGTLSSYAATSEGTSVAASGLLGADGAIAVDEDQAPGTPPAATVDLTQVLDQLGVEGVTDQILEELRLEVGAFAARAETDGTTV
ncbi:choice-of-anchor G family protein, partial [Burkholderia cenocepacia]|uniref:choice-of-anchor G family protein n=1 Tax=Burkholderia cenocepacia TaxID=95486 RepID=UPI0038CC0A20